MAKTYVVKAGATLSKTAKEILGDAARVGAYEPS